MISKRYDPEIKANIAQAQGHKKRTQRIGLLVIHKFDIFLVNYIGTA